MLHLCKRKLILASHLGGHIFVQAQFEIPYPLTSPIWIISQASNRSRNQSTKKYIGGSNQMLISKHQILAPKIPGCPIVFAAGWTVILSPEKIMSCRWPSFASWKGEPNLVPKSTQLNAEVPLSLLLLLESSLLEELGGILWLWIKPSGEKCGFAKHEKTRLKA